MATALGEVIQLLSFDGSVFSGEAYTTEKVLVQEFCSMSITILTSQNASFRLSFSNNGVDFDYNSSSTIKANVAQTITTVILGKWTRLRYLNAGNIASIIRFSTYCQVSPVSFQAQIEKQGNTFPSVNVDNLSGSLFNDLRVSEEKIIHQHKFDYGRIVGGVLVDPDRGYVQFNGGGINPALSFPSIDNGVFSVYDIFKSPIGAYQGLRGPSVVYVAGNPFIVSFSAKFDISGYTNGSTFGYDNMLIGAGWVSLGTPPDPPEGQIVDGIFLGYPAIPIFPDTVVKEISLVYYNNNVESYTPRSKWLFDTLDGNGNSGLTLDLSKLSTWRIRTAHSACSIYLEYHSPSDNIWFPCHRLVYENLNLNTNFQNPSFCSMIYTKRTNSTVSTTGTKSGAPGCGHINVGLENGISSISDLYTYGLDGGLVSIVANIEKEIITVRAGELLNLKINRAVIQIMIISFSTSGTKPCLFKIYRNGSFIAPVFTYQDVNKTPIQTRTGGSYVIGTGELVLGNYEGKETNSALEIDKLRILLDYVDTLTITCKSTGASDINVFITYGLIK